MTTTTSDAAASRTLLGNLTTTFTQPASCTLAWLGAPDSGTASGWLAQDCHPVSRDEFTNEDDTDCWPPRMTGVPTPTATPRVWANGWGYYSPGYICPAGYITACSATAGGSSDFSMQFPLTAGETAIGCCPRFAFFYAHITPHPLLYDSVSIMMRISIRRTGDI